MRAVALAVVLAVGPVGPTVCMVRCAEASVADTMTGMSHGAGRHQMHDMSSHHVTDASMAGQDETGTDRQTLADGATCAHSHGVEPSILRGADPGLSATIAQAVLPATFEAARSAIVLHVEPFLSPSPPPHAPPLLPLRI